VSRHDGSLWNHSPNFLLISHVLVSREMEKLLFCKKLFFFFFVVNLGWYTYFQLLFTFYNNISGLFVIWRRRVFVHFPRSLQGCYAISVQWSLVKACGYYVPLCKHTFPCPGFIIYLFFLSMFSLGFSFIESLVSIFCMSVQVCRS
jgi:hypothetical protein